MKTLAPVAGWTALISGTIALLIYVAWPVLNGATVALGWLALVSGLLFVVIDRKNLGRALKSRQTLYGMTSSVLVLAVLGILIFANILVKRHKQTFDFTETGYFTLSPQTKKILQSLDRDVKLIGFFSGSDPSLLEFKTMMDNFKAQSDHIQSEVVDPDKNPAITKQYGITTYSTVSVESGDKSTQVKKLTEENLVNAFLQVTTEKRKKVYFLEGHGEKDITDQQNTGYIKARNSLAQDGFEVDKVLLLQTAKVPDDAELLIINGPMKIIPRKEQEAIEAYLNKGGSVLLMLDPQEEPGMGSLLKRWGIELRDDIVVDPTARLFGGDNASPVISQYGAHGITNNFALPTIFPLVRSVVPVKADGVGTQELLYAGPNSWAETDYRDGKVKFDQSKDLKGPVSVAVASTRALSNPESKASSKKEMNSEKSAPKANLVVIGDSDFASNQYFDFSGNGDFFSNTASWLLEEESLISIRPKVRKNSPLALTKLEGNLIFLLGTIVAPAIVFLTGMGVWWRRRKL